MSACPRHSDIMLAPDVGGGLCPKCVLQVALPSPPPSSVGGYTIVKEIDRGGMGVVYQARDRSLDRTIALKMIRAGELASDEARARFVAEVQLLSRFDHPGIVRIFDANVGPDGYPYYTMPWIEGGSLARNLARFKDPHRAARLMATVARAVQFCHDARPEPVLHRDLKPANILLGLGDHPYLADFGIAKALGTEGGTRSGAIVGTLEYMAPEQAAGGKITPAVDVYGLGAITYELLTGSPPLGSASPPELLHRIRYQEPQPPRELASGVPRSLERICLRALEKDPQRRYATASDFADDLERVLRGEPIAPPPQARWRAALDWMARHRLFTVGAAGALLVLVIAMVATMLLVRDQRAELLRRAIQINAFAAHAQAGAMLNQLREHAERVERSAEDEALRRALAGEPIGSAALKPHAHGFTGMTLFKLDGSAQLRWPEPPEALAGHRFTYRDYFKAATQLGRARVARAYLAPAYHAAFSKQLQFAIATPTFDEQGALGGVLLAMMPTSNAFGAVDMDDMAQSGRMTALIAPREAAQAAASIETAERYLVLVHPNLGRAQECELPARYAALLRRAFGASAPPGEQFAAVRATPVTVDDYRDAVTQSGERWLAAFAPVGRTGYAVLVQSRYDDATPASSTLQANALRVGLPLFAAVFALWVVMLRITRRNPLGG